MDTLDTLTLALLDRENQGPLEAEYSYGGEADLHRHYDGCKKNPGHNNFIPVDKFSIEDLPEDYRDKNLMKYIQITAYLTVRVIVKCVSDRRPATLPGSDIPYSGYIARGTRRVTVGTGCVGTVDVFENCKRQHTCECIDCKNYQTPGKSFATINIQTATHVVFDQLEADHTTFHLFFDRGNIPETCKGVVTLTGGRLYYKKMKGDECYIKCFTHDLDLAERLKMSLMERGLLRRRISINYNFGKQKLTLTAGFKQLLLFIVSHPHGCSKQVSLGYLISVHTYNNKIVSYQYSTPTCPGSSGAVVHLPDMYQEPIIDCTLFDVNESHCGKSDDLPGINFCPTNEHIRLPQPVTCNMLQFDEGLLNDCFSCVEEEDIQKQFDACRKNPGHKNFFPTDKLSMDKLPPVYRTDAIFDLIRIVSDLTVRVSVKYVSEKRPETVPGTDIPYPWYSHRGSNQLREGNGAIIHIVVYDKFYPSGFSKICECKECQSSLSPKTEFAWITIKSTTHLVYDRLEAEHTTCQIVVDSRIVTLTELHYYINSIDRDICTFTFVSHDMDLAYTIRTLVTVYEYHDLITLDDSLNLNLPKFKFLSFNSDDDKQNIRKKLRKEPPLYVVVSHPHGCAKQISISYCSNHTNTDTEDNQSPYASIICPGSSGAPLVRMGWETFYPEIKVSILREQCH